jgi:hypothetical protein
MDKAHFETVRQQYLSGVGSSGTAGLAASSIGTLGEKALHAIVKSYIEPDPTIRRSKSALSMSTVLTARTSRNPDAPFHKLNAKLETLCPNTRSRSSSHAPRKWLLWIDPLTVWSATRACRPSAAIRPIFSASSTVSKPLAHPNFSLLILLIDLEEYRLLNGWSDDRKRSHRSDRLPLRWKTNCGSSPPRFFPVAARSLPDIFTAPTYAKAARTSRSTAQIALNILRSLGVIKSCGKSGRALTYCRASSTSQDFSPRET